MEFRCILDMLFVYTALMCNFGFVIGGGLWTYDLVSFGYAVHINMEWGSGLG